MRDQIIKLQPGFLAKPSEEREAVSRIKRGLPTVGPSKRARRAPSWTAPDPGLQKWEAWGRKDSRTHMTQSPPRARTDSSCVAQQEPAGFRGKYEADDLDSLTDTCRLSHSPPCRLSSTEQILAAQQLPESSLQATPKHKDMWGELHMIPDPLRSSIAALPRAKPIPLAWHHVLPIDAYGPRDREFSRTLQPQYSQFLRNFILKDINLAARDTRLDLLFAPRMHASQIWYT